MQEEATLEAKVNYSVKTEQFEGPLDLLLTLIEKRKLFINDFSLAKVADDYIAQIRSFSNFPISDVANFLVVASALVLIKSKSILPQISLSQEEEGSIDDLKLRLSLYELFRNLGNEIKSIYAKNPLYERRYIKDEKIVFAPDRRLTADMLGQSIDQVIHALPKHVPLPAATVKKVISLEEMVERLSKNVSSALRLSFGEFSRYKKGASIPKEDRVMIIVSFLAMLEMVKQGVLHVTQHEDHGDIHMETREIDTPLYV
jgi:segregation and condensation protein A